MSENWKIQVSPKLADGTLVNLRAETPEQAGAILEWAIGNAAKIQEAAAALIGVASVAAAFPGPGTAVVDSQPAPWGQPQQAPAPAFAQPAPATTGPTPTQQHCAHGAMTYREGTGKTGNPYKAWFCPARKGDPTQCPAQFIR